MSKKAKLIISLCSILLVLIVSFCLFWFLRPSVIFVFPSVMPKKYGNSLIKGSLSPFDYKRVITSEVNLEKTIKTNNTKVIIYAPLVNPIEGKWKNVAFLDREEADLELFNEVLALDENREWEILLNSAKGERIGFFYQNSRESEVKDLLTLFSDSEKIIKPIKMQRPVNDVTLSLYQEEIEKNEIDSVFMHSASYFIPLIYAFPNIPFYFDYLDSAALNGQKNTFGLRIDWKKVIKNLLKKDSKNVKLEFVLEEIKN